MASYMPLQTGSDIQLRFGRQCLLKGIGQTAAVLECLQQCELAVRQRFNFDIELASNREQLDATLTQIDLLITAEALLVDLPDAQDRIGRDQQAAGRMQREADSAMLLHRYPCKA